MDLPSQSQSGNQQYGLMHVWICARLCTTFAAIKALVILLAVSYEASCWTK